MIFTLSSSLMTERRDALEFAPDRVIVGIAPDNQDAVDRLLADVPGSRVLDTFDSLDGMLVLALPEGLAVEDAVAQISALPYVAYAEPDHVVGVASGALQVVGIPTEAPEDRADALPGPSPEVARCIAVAGWWLDFFTEAITDGTGTVTGYLEITTGPGFNSVTEYDADMAFVRSEYRDDSGYRSATVRETLRDPDGNVTGYRESSSGDGQGVSYQSSALYDARFNLIEADHSSSDGYLSTTRRTELLDDSRALSGYLLESSGGDGSWSYTSKEVFDTDHQLLSSDYSDTDGYSSSYRREIERDASGNVTGYIISYSWGYDTETYSGVDRYDADWNFLGGDADEPPLIIDEGPTILPVVKLYSEGDAREARSSVELSAITAEDASGGEGTLLRGTDGNDTFVVDDMRDRVRAAGHGDDTVVSGTISIDLRRDAFNGIESASLVGRGDLRLRGDAGNNALSGNAGDNRIDGGRGSDSLFGGLGEDVFVIRGGRESAPDRVADFNAGEDRLALAGQRFQQLFDGNGGLRDGVFGDRLLFDADAGEIVYDRDGSAGAASGIVIAVLVGVSELDADDFIAG